MRKVMNFFEMREKINQNKRSVCVEYKMHRKQNTDKLKEGFYYFATLMATSCKKRASSLRD